MKRGSVNNNKINLSAELVEINFIEIGICQLSPDCVFLIFQMESSHPSRKYSFRARFFLSNGLPDSFHPLSASVSSHRFYPRENFTNHSSEQYPFANKSRKIKARPCPSPRVENALHPHDGSASLRLVNQQRIVSSTIGGVTMHSRNWRPTPVVGSVEL